MTLAIPSSNELEEYMMKLKTLLVATATAFTMASAFAAPAGTWSLGVGAGYVMPESNNGTMDTPLGEFELDVDGDVRPTITAEYFVANNIGIELLAATPFKHDMTLTSEDGLEVDAQAKHLPPTLSLQYHFDGVDMPVKPFIGVGVNYTTFFDESIYVPVEGDFDLDIDDSVGVAGHVGVDIPFSASEAVRVDARYIDLESDVKLNDQDIGTAEINPWVFGVSYVKNF